MHDQVQARLAELAILESYFLGASMRRRDTYRHTLKMVDLLAWGALKRTLFLVAGFSRMVADRNLVCAGALLRLQLDTALRFHSVFLVEDPEEFAAKVISGTPVKNLAARGGEFLSDHFLVRNAASEFPWVAEVYREASGYIHFSEKHLWSAQSAVASSKNAVVTIEIGSYDDAPDNLFVEAIDAFKKTADLLDGYVIRWFSGSGNVGAAQ